MATGTRTRKVMTADDYKAKLEKAKEAYKALEQKAYATELEALIKEKMNPQCNWCSKQVTFVKDSILDEDFIDYEN